MTYSFNLDWGDLDEDFRNKKIDEVIEYDFSESNLLDADGEPLFASLDEALNDIDLRRKTERFIEAHFPMYF